MVGHDDGAVKIVGFNRAPKLMSMSAGQLAAEIHRALSH